MVRFTYFLGQFIEKTIAAKTTTDIHISRAVVLVAIKTLTILACYGSLLLVQSLISETVERFFDSGEKYDGAREENVMKLARCEPWTATASQC